MEFQGLIRKKYVKGGFHMNGISWSFVFICMAGLAVAETALPKQPGEERPLGERFLNPPAATRILRILHGQHDTPAEQDKILQALADQGFGGFAGNVNFTGYVDDPTKWPPFVRGVKMAKASGMSLWLYDECGYPSGSARDLVLRGHPEWAARGLLVAMTNVAAGTAVTFKAPPGLLVGAVALPVREGKLVRAEAIPINTAVTDSVLTWKTPEKDSWCLLLMTEDFIYHGTHAEVSLAFKKPYINLLMADPTAKFLQVTHAQYAAHLGKDLGRYFDATFTDEPSLMSLWMRPQPFSVLPWSPTLVADYRAATGRDLISDVPALVAATGNGDAAIRFGFWSLIGQQVAQNFFGQIQTWCQAHGVPSGGHLLAEESIEAHVPLYGDFFACIRRLDAPSIDCLTSLPPNVPWQTAKLLASVAELNQNRLVMCEVSDHSENYRPEGDQRPRIVVSEEQVRGTCNLLQWGGINTFTSYYHFRQFDTTALQRINSHIGRCGTMLKGGHLVADIAVLYPSASLMAAYEPTERWSTGNEVRAVAESFRQAGNMLFAAQRDFMYIDSEALQRADLSKGALEHGELRWRVVVLPSVTTLSLKAMRKIHAFWKRGGVVIALMQVPVNSEQAFPCPEISALSREMFAGGDQVSTVTSSGGGLSVFLPQGVMGAMPKVLDRVLARDFVACGEKSAAIRMTHRKVDGYDLFFVINTLAEPWQGRLQFLGEGPFELWNPEDGSVVKQATNVFEQVTLRGYGAKIFRTRQAGVPSRLDGGRPLGCHVEKRTLPAIATASIGANRTVKTALEGSSETGWQTQGQLTQGGIDTHLFLCLRYAKPFSLKDADGIIIETDVAANQETRADILVFIEIAGGQRYLASTGRGLRIAGCAQSMLLFSQFKPFDKVAGPLDPGAITAIQVGWGGYFGKEGETIRFGVKAPQGFAIQ